MLTFALTSQGEVFGIEEARTLRSAGSKLPPVLCPACHKHLIAKLGSRVAHHFAHQPNTEPCFGSTGEGELHISAKLKLLRALQQMAAEEHELRITCPCSSCDGHITTVAAQLRPGDRAEVEVWLDPTRTLKPDLTLWRGGQRVVILEVLATHPCGPEKLAALERHGVPMVEVEAKAVVGVTGYEPWDAPNPLPFKNVVGINVQEQCDSCRQEEEELEAARRRAAEVAEQQRLAPHARIVAHCWVHIFLGNGVRRDLLFVVVQHWDKGEITHAELVEDNAEETIKRWDGDIAKDRDGILAAARAIARAHCSKSPKNPWVELDTYGGFQVGDKLGKEPFQNFWWSVKQRKWVKVRFQNGLHNRLGVSPEAIERQIQAGRFRTIEVKVFANANKVVTALEAEGVESFENWLREKNGGKLPERRRYWRWDD